MIALGRRGRLSLSPVIRSVVRPGRRIDPDTGNSDCKSRFVRLQCKSIGCSEVLGWRRTEPALANFPADRSCPRRRPAMEEFCVFYFCFFLFSVFFLYE